MNVKKKRVDSYHTNLAIDCNRFLTTLNKILISIDKVVNTPAMAESMSKQGLTPQTNSPEEFMAFIRAKVAKSAELIKVAGLKAK